MPIKAHVKGKRKAPLPPTTSSIDKVATASASNIQLGINQSENKFPNGKTGKLPETMSCFTTIQKRKKPAPLPPITNYINNTAIKEKHDTGNEMNNLSAISKRFSDKSAAKAINLNIFEPNNIRNQFHCKETNEVNVNMNKRCDSNNNNNPFFACDQRNEQIWICNYCTLQNPFWKIICDACERIKPYNTPTITNKNFGFSPNVVNTDARVNEKNVMSSVIMRSKTNRNTDVDKILNRNSVNVVGIKSASSSKQLPNKRNSLCLFKYGDQNISPEVLEMEKERIRSLIRAMNSRALAQKNTKKLDEHRRIDGAKTDVAAIKTATINKLGLRQNGLQKYNSEKDYNLPSVRKNASGECETKEKASRKIENNTNNIAKCNEIVKINETYCDQVSSTNTETEYDSNTQRKSDATTATKYSIKSGIENDILLYLYINFNNAIELKIPCNITLDELKMYAFDKLMPCKNPRIYFNGLLLRNGEQSLAKYGITNQSSLYINTENVAVQANANAKTERKSVIIQTEEPNQLSTRNDKNKKREKDVKNEPIKAVKQDEQQDEKKDKANDEKELTNALLVENTGENKNGEKFVIDHPTLNRYLIERVPPRNESINKVKYRGVYNYNPRCNPEIIKILNEKPVARPVKKPSLTSMPSSYNKPIDGGETTTKAEITNNEPVTQYIKLLSLDDSMDLTKNSEIFECSICLVDYQPLEGVILRNCLHTFCKDCIRSTIIYSDEAEVKCPYMDNQYSCDCSLQDREVKALLSKSEYDEHLAKSLRIAENQIENSFHCKTPDCKGWCIYEDDVNTFKCPICRLENCLTCRVVHDGLDCKQYQNMMKNNPDNNPENATTHAMLEEMIKNGEAMNCPACKIVLMKKWGCDWLKCSMCKTEICWITRGYRWGPAGKGDTSSGCRCGVDGFRCHPKCNYCH